VLIPSERLETMDVAGNNPLLTGHEVRELQLLIEQRSGVVFDESRERFLTSRVIEHMQSKQLNFGAELLRLIRNSNVEYDNLLERLLTQETRFLRYPGLFAAFEQHVLPEMLRREAWAKGRPLRVWSAGCASGEEPYSVALSVMQAAALREGLSAEILATDISRNALERAERGIYRKRVLEHLTPGQISCFFSPVEDGYQVKPIVREMVKFVPLNLAQPMYPGHFDCIFCMNVLIYFSTELRVQLIQRFYDYLEPGGYLFLGHAESVANVPVKFEQKVMHGARLLQKPLKQSSASTGGEA
jgi:chemotaxis protein methyltransferase CheR